MNEISVEELAQWRSSGKKFVLLDVRTPREIAIVSLPDSTNIGMHELVARTGELDPHAEIAVICHSGNRSGFVTEILTRRGFEHVYNVAGGIDAYAARVDPSLARY